MITLLHLRVFSFFPHAIVSDEVYLFRRHGVDENPSLEVEEFKNQSAVYVGVDGDLAGIIYFEDKIREDASRVVESLSKEGIDVYMLSGDKKHTAEYVASMVGIQKEKVRILRPQILLVLHFI